MMNLAFCESLVRELERYPTHVPAYYSELEAAIKWLVDTRYKEANLDKKIRMAATAMRARFVLERFRK